MDAKGEEVEGGAVSHALYCRLEPDGGGRGLGGARSEVSVQFQTPTSSLALWG